MPMTKEERREYMSRWVAKHRQHFRSIVRETKRRRRLELITRLGGKCESCGISDHRCLQIDHKEGGGIRELRQYNDSYKYCVTLLRMSDEELRAKYQLLCANCNWIKRFERNEHGAKGQNDSALQRE